ncbi:MAG: ATP-binding protein [Rubrivivax sp.]|nr:ATP-binding protein [Rubrivivax sp.]MDP3614107.1 ATP-binding protein [Rubrivivax sp.]
METQQDTALLIAELHLLSLHGGDDASALDRMLEHVVQGFGAVSGCLAVLDEAQPDQIVITAGVDLPAGALGSRIALGSGVLGSVAAHGKPRLLAGARPGAAQRDLGVPASSICWPMMIKSRLIGALSINRTAGSVAFTQDDVERGATFVTVLALLVDNAGMRSQQQQRIDHLSTLNAEMLAINGELKATQAQLLQSEKMASIGQLAAGVAHEINNPIGYVYANFNTLSGYVTDLLAVARGGGGGSAKPLDLEFLSEDLPDLLRETRDGLDRVTKIVRDLKDFSRVDTSDAWESADVLAGLESTLNIVQNEVKYKATIDRQLVALPAVCCRPSEINQVFMNLLVNAAQSIPERGVIRLASGFDDEQVWVEVADTGKGMTPEVRNRIFEPFYTTKPVGQGTGLGLSLSYTIVQKHHGRIDVDSEPGRGTTFRVTLPRRQPEASGVALPKEAAHV